jgi:hypothetical protein
VLGLVASPAGIDVVGVADVAGVGSADDERAGVVSAAAGSGVGVDVPADGAVRCRRFVSSPAAAAGPPGVVSAAWSLVAGAAAGPDGVVSAAPVGAPPPAAGVPGVASPATGGAWPLVDGAVGAPGLVSPARVGA